MQNGNPAKVIQIPISAVNASDLIQQQADEIFQLRQTVDKLTNALAAQNELIQQLKDEIARLKGQKPRPKIPPSRLEGPNSKPDLRQKIGPGNAQSKISNMFSWCVRSLINGNVPSSLHSARISIAFASQTQALKISKWARSVIKETKRIGKPGQPRGTLRKKKKTVLPIHEIQVIQPENIPEGAKFKGYRHYAVQEIIFRSHNIQYQLARWKLPDGSYITGKLPEEVHGHYGPELVAYILHQYHACRVTEPLLLEQLRAIGVLISAGQLNNILILNQSSFISEAAELLSVAATIENQLQVDDTGGRHNGQNQYTTIIGNRWASVFVTTDSKSRVNFLKQLQNGKEEYVINADTLEYLSQVNAPGYLPGYIALCLGSRFTALVEWKQFLKEHNITREGEMRFLTEAALYASVIQNGIPRTLGVHSDDAGQFDVFCHSLCWIHEERHYRKLIMTTDESQIELERVEEQIWSIYQDLKAYKECPGREAARRIDEKFNDIFQQRTSSPTLNRQLDKTYAKKQELLRVLDRPETPLHNNSTETCARAAKIKLKISGGTRSKEGQAVRDTFLSLKQTCRKLGINFWGFLQDRIRGRYEIPRLVDVILERAIGAIKDPSGALLSSAHLDSAVLQHGNHEFVG